MKREHFYSIVIIFLLLINIGTLTYLWIGPKERRLENEHGRHHPPLDRIIIERLQLDERQIARFHVIKREHHQQMITIQHTSSALHSKLFQLLKADDVDTAKRNELLLKLQMLDREKELATFDHFEKMRGMLRAEQQGYFDDFVEDLSRRLLAPLPRGQDR